jgi:hypothetical protein
MTVTDNRRRPRKSSASDRIAFVEAIIDDPRFPTLSERSQLVLLVMGIRHADADGRCWPSRARLARLLGAHRDTIRRAMRDLFASGLLVAEPHYGSSRKQTTDTLTIVLRPEGAAVHSLDGSGCADGDGGRASPHPVSWRTGVAALHPHEQELTPLGEEENVGPTGGLEHPRTREPVPDILDIAADLLASLRTEPSLDHALRDPELFAEHVEPYAVLIDDDLYTLRGSGSDRPGYDTSHTDPGVVNDSVPPANVRSDTPATTAPLQVSV